jgi:glycosyltransferase involved in cell wall biosynthesis
LRELGIAVEIIPLADGIRTRSRTGLGPATVLRSTVATVPFVLRLAWRLNRLRPDVVHTTSLKADLLGTVAAKLAGVPVVWHVHDRIADEYLPRPVVRAFRWLAARLPRAVVVNSHATGATVGRADAVVAYPGFAADQVRPGPVEDRIDPPTPVVGLIGRISPTKGQMELIEAVPSVLKEFPQARFRLIGAPLFGEQGYADTVARRIGELGLAETVELTGSVDDVAAELDRMTVLVHASPVPEPFGQVVVEGMIRGVPVIATDSGGVPEILEGGRLGVLVPPGDPSALAAAIVTVLADDEGRARRAVEAHAVALSRFPMTRTADVITATWQQVARRRSVDQPSVPPAGTMSAAPAADRSPAPSR